MLKISLVQMRCEKAAIGLNLEAITRYLAEARARNVDIVGFPEMSITGYADPTRYPQAILQVDGPEIRQFLALTRGFPMTVLAGLIEANPALDGGAPAKPFITQIAVRNGRLLGLYRKVTIKNEEERWFTPGDVFPVFHRGALPYAISICADIGNETVFAEAARQGVKIVFELAAPGLYGEQATRNWQSGFNWWRGENHEKLAAYARKYHLWIATATQAGRTIDEDFPGGGYVFAPDGQCLFETPDWSEGAAYLALDFKSKKVTAL